LQLGISENSGSFTLKYANFVNIVKKYIERSEKLEEIKDSNKFMLQFFKYYVAKIAT
jgi:hypothetical protein